MLKKIFLLLQTRLPIDLKSVSLLSQFVSAMIHNNYFIL